MHVASGPLGLDWGYAVATCGLALVEGSIGTYNPKSWAGASGYKPPAAALLAASYIFQALVRFVATRVQAEKGAALVRLPHSRLTANS